MMQRILYWLPRLLGSLLVVFLSLFALDVFSEGYGVAETILALFMHLIPSFLVLTVLLIAWRWERLGALLFALLAVLYVVFSRVDIIAFLIIAGPALVTGALFFLHDRLNVVAAS